MRWSGMAWDGVGWDGVGMGMLLPEVTWRWRSLLGTIANHTGLTANSAGQGGRMLRDDAPAPGCWELQGMRAISVCPICS